MSLAENRPDYEPSKMRLTWPNGATAMLRSADKPDLMRGPQYHWAIADELCAWSRPESWDLLMFGLRLGRDPRIAVATTPKPTRLLRTLLKEPTTAVTRGSTYDNRDNLAPAFFTQIINRYEGTRLGRQELNAELLDDVEGALWTYDMLDAGRVIEAPAMARVVVGVDPKASVEADSETGIVVVGVDDNGHGYVLEDASIDASPEQWARRVVQAYERWQADRVVVEVNQGGDMVVSVLRAVAADVPITAVRASRGKYTRAEPIAAMYEQQKVHHAGTFAGLEDQLCNWTPGDDSPDRLDALVWACSHLLGEHTQLLL